MAKRKTSKKSATSKLSLVTPKGALQWPKLFKPETKFDPDGVYSTDIVFKLDAPGVKEFIDEIETFAEDQDTGPKMPYVIDEDAGTVTLKAKTKAKNRDGAAQRPPVVDAKRNPITENPNIGNGSIAKLSVTFVPYDQSGGGVTCYLGAVQLLELKEYTPGVSAFDEEEGGYEYGICDSDTGDRVDSVDDSGLTEEGVNDGDEEF